jgi:methylmalonyl-CoA carboxyltransferase small subunit
LKLKLTVDGKLYEVDVEVAESERPQPAYVPPLAAARTNAPPVFTPSAAPAPSAGPSDETKVCRSPISGVVGKVSVQVGQKIQANDVLLVLEAMKMETAISSPIAGRVARLNVDVGDSVKAKQVLVEFE